MFKTTKLTYFATIFWVLVQGRKMHPKQKKIGFLKKEERHTQNEKIGDFFLFFNKQFIGFLNKEEQTQPKQQNWVQHT